MNMSRGIERLLKPFLWFSTLFLMVLTLSRSEVVIANPEGGVVAAGNASISTAGNTTTINQTSDKAIINWNTFNIAAGETTQFNQPSAQAIALNRIAATQGASSILGNLTAKGQVWLINPAGILFGQQATVDVAGLMATTANITDANFLSGQYKFIQSPNWNRSVINAGTIRASDGGMVALVAPGVANSGVIQANLGKVVLGAGSDFTVDFYGDNLINFDATGASTPVDQNGNPLKDAVSNTGSIIADGGKVLLTAQVAKNVVDNVINTSGVIQANGIAQRNGEIILTGGKEGVVRVSGRILTAGKQSGQTGGKVKVLGDQVALTDNAMIDASGDAGGGTVLVGGNIQGAGPEQNASYTYVGSDAIINASALNNGNGGTVVIWSDKGTHFYGNITAQGGLQGGNGGFIETSGHWLEALGLANASAPNGLAGTWLLDPYDVTITSSTSNETTSGSGTITWIPTGTATILNTSINSQLTAGSNVIITTTPSPAGGSDFGNITVSSPITNTGTTPVTLTLLADNNIVVNANIGSTSGLMNIVLNADSDASGAGAIQITSANLTSMGGNITLGGGVGAAGAAVGNGILVNGIDLNNAQLLAGGGNISLNGTGSPGGSFLSHNGVWIHNGSQAITSGTGTISITGQGGVTSGSMPLGDNNGVLIADTSVVDSQGTGVLTITGTGGSVFGSGTGQTGEHGISVTGGTVKSNNGTLTLTGTGGGVAGESSSDGISLSGGTILSYGTANMVMAGTPGVGGLGINQTSGTISGGLLITTSTAGTLLNGTNTVTGFNATNATSGNISLTNTAATLTIAGMSETGGGNTTINNTGNIVVSGNVNSGVGTTNLISTGTIGQAGSSVISGLLSTSSVGGTLLTNTNTLTNFSATNTTSGNIDLDNTASLLTITGISQAGGGNISIDNTGGLTVSTTAITAAGAGAITLAAKGGSGDLTINKNITAVTGAITLTSAHNISVNTGTLIQGGGLITLDSTQDLALSGSAISGGVGGILLTVGRNFSESSNAVVADILAGITTHVTGDININSGVLALASNFGNTITAGGNMTIQGGRISNGGSGLLSLNVGGNLNVTGSGTMLWSAAGDMDLTVGGALTVSNNGALYIDHGTLSANVTGNIVLNNGLIGSFVPGNSNIMSLTSGGSITETGTGRITALGSLTTSSATGTALTGANTVTSFGATNTTSGDISLTNTTSLLTLTGINQPVGNLSINNTGGGIAQTGAVIVNGVGKTATFTVNTANSDILLADAANNFSSRPVFTNNGKIRDLALRNINSAATIPTLPTGLRSLTLDFDNAAIVLPAITLIGTLNVASGGPITQSGAINVPIVITSSVGGTDLDYPSNVISEYSGINADSGDIVFTNTAPSFTIDNITQLNGGNVIINGDHSDVTIVNLATGGQTVINAESVTGYITTGGLLLNVDDANLRGTVGGNSGARGASAVESASLSGPNQEFFNGFDLFSLGTAVQNPGIIFANVVEMEVLPPEYELEEETEPSVGSGGSCSAW